MNKIGLIGFGGWGVNWARTLHKLGVLGAICDASPEQQKRAQEQYPSVSLTSSVDVLLKDPDIRGCVIATPSVTHVRIAEQVLRAGKDALVEKPLALNSREAEHLMELARAEGRILMVGHVLEYHPAILKLGELIRQGVLGKIFAIESNRLNFGKIRTEENALWSFAPHDIAIILRLAGALPEDISCTGGFHLNSEIADTTHTHLSFASGLKAHIFVSWLHPFKEHRLVVLGSEQMAVFDDLLPWDQKLKLYPTAVGWVAGKVPVANKAESSAVRLEADEPLAAECRHFLSCIENRRQPLTDGTSGIAVVRILETAQKSLEQKGTVQKYESLPSPRSYVHPTAIVEPGANLGEDTKVWHFAHVMPKVKIGKKCNIGQNVFIANGVRIGNGVKIQNNVSVYDGVVLEDNVFCGPSMVFTNVMNPRSHIERKNEYRQTIVREGATLGANSTIVCGVEIGRFAFVGAGAVVTKSVPAYGLVTGVPAKLTGWMCECAAHKLEFSARQASCPQCHRTYYQSEDHLVEELPHASAPSRSEKPVSTLNH